jgi:hypothetical protein
MKGQEPCLNFMKTLRKIFLLIPVAIRCDFHEYENFKEIKKDYQNIKTLDDLQSNTTVIEVPNSDRLIIQMF